MIRQAQFGCFLLLFAAALPLSGCVGGGFGDVSGSVTLDSQPLSAGTITFYDSGNNPHSDQIKDGKYRLTHVAAGPVKVAVVTPMAIQFGPPAKAGESKPPASKGSPLPDRYNDPDKSGLAYGIKRGDNTINVEMTSR